MENEKQRKPQINIEANPEFITELKEVSKTIEVPYAQIAREAIREKIIRIKSEHPAFADSEERRAFDVMKRELEEYRQGAALAK